MVLPALTAVGGMAANIATMTGTLGIMSTVGNQSLELMQKMERSLRKSSGRLNTVMKTLNRAMVLLFRPLGNLIASLLRPLARRMLKFTRGFNTFTKQVTDAGGILGWIGENINVESLSELGTTIFDKITSAISNIGDNIRTIGTWLWNKITVAVGTINLGGAFADFGSWLWNGITTAIGSISTSLGNFGDWIWETIKNFIASLLPGGRPFSPSTISSPQAPIGGQVGPYQPGTSLGINPTATGGGSMSYTVMVGIDKQIGPTQIAAIQREGNDAIQTVKSMTGG